MHKEEQVSQVRGDGDLDNAEVQQSHYPDEDLGTRSAA